MYYSCRNSYYAIVVNVSSRTLNLYKDGKLIKTYPIAVGKPGNPTPKGIFKIVNKAANPGGEFGAKWLGLSIPHFGIHGTNDPSSIGKAKSEGCVRMYNKDIIELYYTVPVGTTVKII